MVPKDFLWRIVRRKKRYYVRFLDIETKDVISEKAVAVIAQKIGIRFDGIVGGRQKDRMADDIVRKFHENTRNVNLNLPRVLEYVRDYWDFDGERVLLANKKNPNAVARSSCYASSKNFEKYLVKYFPDNPRIGEITSRRLNEIQDDILKKSTLANATVKRIMCAVIVPLNAAFKYGLTENSVKIDSLNTKGAEKGILTETQLADIIRRLYELSRNGEHMGANEGIALAALTAMRLGEIRALKTEQFEIIDDKDTIVHITRAWSDLDHEKLPKGKRSRQAIVPTVIAKACIELANKNPCKTGYVFWSDKKPDSVRSATFFRDILYRAMADIGITEEIRKERNITFHSLRHGYVSYIRHQVSDGTMRLAVGHRDKETTDRYTHLNKENLKELAESTNKTFAEVIKVEQEIIDS
ncbi:MAG: tyrosine-type recombinase/integrase [Sphaerochaeta sp.]